MPSPVLTALTQIAHETGVSTDVVQHSIESAILAAYRRTFGRGIPAQVRWDPVQESFRLWCPKTLVTTPTDPRVEIAIAEARAVFPDASLGDVLEFEITPPDFSRLAVKVARQVLTQHLAEARHAQRFSEFLPLRGTCVSGRVLRLDAHRIVVELAKMEGLLNPHEQVPQERLHVGDILQCYVMAVKATARQPLILLSRRHPALVARLLEQVVPELASGVVCVENLVREAGARTKIAVRATQPWVDPVSLCVGPQGLRLDSVIHELRGEHVDVVLWSDDPATYITSALGVPSTLDVELDPQTRRATVLVPPLIVPRAIGAQGLNARLASRLTGWRITVTTARNPLTTLLASPASPTEDSPNVPEPLAQLV